MKGRSIAIWLNINPIFTPEKSIMENISIRGVIFPLAETRECLIVRANKMLLFWTGRERWRKSKSPSHPAEQWPWTLTIARLSTPLHRCAPTPELGRGMPTSLQIGKGSPGHWVLRVDSELWIILLLNLLLLLLLLYLYHINISIIIIFLWFCVYECFVCMYICAPPAHLWATVWVLGNESRYLARTGPSLHACPL